MAGRFASFLVAGTVTVVLVGCVGTTDGRPAADAPTVAQTQEELATERRPSREAEPTPVEREVFEFTGFISPTGNVSCMIDRDYARCDIIDRDWSPPPRPADCEYDYGQGISLSPDGGAEFVCAGDTAFGAEDVLAYGDAITAGPIRCESAESGITCRDSASGHGFSMSRQAYQLF